MFKYFYLFLILYLIYAPGYILYIFILQHSEVPFIKILRFVVECKIKFNIRSSSRHILIYFNQFSRNTIKIKTHAHIDKYIYICGKNYFYWIKGKNSAFSKRDKWRALLLTCRRWIFPGPESRWKENAVIKGNVESDQNRRHTGNFRTASLNESPWIFSFTAKCARREKKEMVTNGIESKDRARREACVLGENFMFSFCSFLFLLPPLTSS